MNADAPNKPSETDWARVDAMTDEEIDTSDIPPLTQEQLARMTVRLPGESRPSTVELNVSVDAKTAAWFDAQGADRERRIRAALRLYAAAHTD